MHRTEQNRIVAVAMSGGVDSSVAAAVLIEQGYDVIGVTMCLLKDMDPEDMRRTACCTPEAVEDARRVAAKLGIRHVVIPMQETFEQFVIEDFIEEYRRGHTPNPCVRCNQFIKFEALLKWAQTMGAEKLATGHYARISHDDARGRWLLLRGKDRSKDQSYALYQMTQEQLERTLFPLGEMTKVETRRMASELGLVVAEKRDSQEICFVPGRDYGAFLRMVAPELAEPGPLVDTSGKVLGEHQGIAFYTVGQRKGLGISSPTPKYVVRVESESNTVVIGENEDLLGKTLVAKDLNLISIAELTGSLAVTAKIRYNTKDSAAVVRPLFKNAAEVVFDQPQRAITPGQAVVMYQDEVVVGGGTIADAEEIADG